MKPEGVRGNPFVSQRYNENHDAKGQFATGSAGGGRELRTGHEVTVKGERGSFIVTEMTKNGKVRVNRRDPLGGTKSWDARLVPREDVTGRVHRPEVGSLLHDDALAATHVYTAPGDTVKLYDPSNDRIVQTFKVK